MFFVFVDWLFGIGDETDKFVKLINGWNILTFVCEFRLIFSLFKCVLKYDMGNFFL